MEASTKGKGRPRKDPNYKPPVKPENRVVDLTGLKLAGQDNPTVKTVLDNAKAAIERRMALNEEIQESRIVLHMFIKQGICSHDQAEWILKYLPRKGEAMGAQENGSEE